MLIYKFHSDLIYSKHQVAPVKTEMENNHFFEELSLVLNTGIEITINPDQYGFKYCGFVTKLSQGVVTLLVFSNESGYSRATFKISKIEELVYKAPLPTAVSNFENNFKTLVFDWFSLEYDIFDLFRLDKQFTTRIIKDFAIEHGYSEPALYQDTTKEIKQLQENFDNFSSSLYEAVFEKCYKQILKEFHDEG